MAKLFFDAENCRGATSGATGRSYDADKKGFITVTDPTDIKCLTAGGYMIAGGMPKLKRYFRCECGWEASINHCSKCDRDDLERVEK